VYKTVQYRSLQGIIASAARSNQCMVVFARIGWPFVRLVITHT